MGLDVIMKFKMALKAAVTIMFALTVVLAIAAATMGGYAATPVYPVCYIKASNGFEYANGAEENKIDIFVTGYTYVNFLDNPSLGLSYEPDDSGK